VIDVRRAHEAVVNGGEETKMVHLWSNNQNAPLFQGDPPGFDDPARGAQG